MTVDKKVFTHIHLHTYFSLLDGMGSPEERVLMQKPDSNVSIVDEGVAICTHIEDDAVAIQTKVAMSCLPSLDILPDQIVSLKVVSA